MDLCVEDFELDAKVFYDQTGQVLYISHQTRGVVEKWTRQRNIGIGGYAQVFLERSDSGKLRAVKEVKRSGDSSDYMKELRPMAVLSRDKDLFVQLTGWFTSERYIYIAMEYLHLGDIRACYEGPLSEPEVKDVGKQLLEGLEKMHKMRITHRDIKPKNILVVQKFPIWVKIADFGISKGDGSALQTMIGTQGFMAPEILGSRNPEYTNAVDLWSLGCVLYFLLTKDEPFPKLWQLFQYERGEIAFPEDNLNSRNVSVAGIEFIKGLMKAEPLSRTLVSNALNDRWVRDRSQSAQFLLQNGFDINAVGFNANLALLLAAAKDHRGDMVRLLLRNGANVAAKTALLWTALHVAADRGHEAVVRLLLEKEADVAAETTLLWTALHLAADRGHEAVVRLLLGKKADVAAKTTRLWTALHLAANRGHEAVVRLLLEKGADVAVRTYDGHTALHRAAENGHEAVVRLLLKEGGDIETKTNDGRTALYVATGSGHEGVVRLLVEKRTDVKDLSARKWLASAKLLGAAKNGDEAVVRQMLKQGVDIEAETNDGGTALHRAAESGHEGVVRLLLEEGADVEAKTYTGWTALHGAAGSGHKTVVQLLLDRGANVKAKTYTGWTALHGAVGSGHKTAVQLLLNRGADVEAKTYTGWTALHGAARSGQEVVVQLLLSKGANVAAKTYTGRTPLHEAARSGHEAMVQLLASLAPDF